MKRITIKEIFSSGIRIAIPAVFGILSSSTYGQDPNQNYVKTTTYKAPSSTTITNTDPDKVAIAITYLDGLGRPMQKISHKQSGNGNDLITHIAYDGFGRQPMEFLPYERSASLVLDGNAYANLTGFYSNASNGPTTSNPWSEKLFEESPLNRVLKQAAPGNEWVMDGGHEVKLSYETNSATEVHHFSVSLSGSNPGLVYDGKYPEGQLYKTVTKDENWQSDYGAKGTVTQFTDKMGRMVLRRIVDVPIGEGKDATGAISLDTYYIYDVYGNLTYVLPPKLSEQIISGGSLVGNYYHLLDELGYQYKYDHRNRAIIKKIPGRQWEYMVYDALDRPIAVGPILSPFGDYTEGWLHTKYDIHNRVAYTLWKQGTVNESTREGLAGLPTYISEFRTPGTTNVNNVSFSYSNQVEPTSGYHVLTVNYYDDYAYTGAPSTIPTTVGDGGDVTVHYNNTTLKPKGLPTGSWVRQLETTALANAIKSYSIYDNKARPVRVYSANAAGGYTQTDTKFDFIGSPLYTKTDHKKNTAATLLTTKDVFTYTNQSRPLKHTHKINTGAEQLLSLNSYDALGRLTSKKVGGSDISGTAALQKVDYRYNVRGWLTGINNINALNESGAPVDLFAFLINYTHVADDINGAVEPLYNGNIAETFWRTSSDNMVRKYGYAYDHQNRLLDAYYQRPGTSVPRSDSYSTHYGYDRNGNILSLERNGENDVATSVVGIDDLAYTYDDGNKLLSVRDYEVSPAGYNDAHTTANQDDFEYDQYGNLILDRDKGITGVEYNHLNLPLKITFATGGKIEYFYDATGTKLKKKVTNGMTITTTEYMDTSAPLGTGSFQYTNNVLDFFPHAEGYVKAVPTGLGGPGGTTGLAFKYVFSYTDHLGNIRLKYAQDPSNGNAISILEEDHYYPYGLKHNGYSSLHLVFTNGDEPGPGIVLTPVNPFLGDSYKYKFGGKEYQDEFDINTYDFGARNYNPALGRWMNIDPLAEQMRRHSPYNYAFDNPVYFIDPDGMMGIPMAVTSLGMGIDGVKDIGSMGGSSGDSGESDKSNENSNQTNPDLTSSNSEENVIDPTNKDIDTGDNAPTGGCEDCPSVEGYKNGEEITHNGKTYVLYDNKWLQIESPNEYNTRIEKRGNQRRPPMPRGAGEIRSYTQKTVTIDGAKSATAGSALIGIEKIMTSTVRFSGVGTVLSFMYGQVDSYLNMVERMEEHDNRVENSKKK